MLRKLLAILQLGVLVASCSSSQGDPRPPASTDDPVTAPDKKKDAGPVCISPCTSDDECARTCPPVTGAKTSCCDLSTGTCYASRVDCPAQVDAGDPGGGGY
jgi:hypothetical protein